MNRDKIMETLEKQLQLLSERSVGLNHTDSTGLLKLTKAMYLVSEILIRMNPPSL